MLADLESLEKRIEQVVKKARGGDKEAIVQKAVIEPIIEALKEGKPAKVVWRVEDTKNGFKVVDIIIENVSLAISARNEYTSVIQKSPNGVDGLIADLKAKL